MEPDRRRIRPLATVSGRSVIVTGGGSGIGRSAALYFAEEGARVAIIDARRDAVSEVVGEAQLLGIEMAGLCADVRDESSLSEAIVSATKFLGQLNTIVVTAGVMLDGATHEISLEEWNSVLGVNLLGPP